MYRYTIAVLKRKSYKLCGIKKSVGNDDVETIVHILNVINITVTCQTSFFKEQYFVILNLE